MSAEHPSSVQQLARRKAWVGAGALALVAIVGIALSGMALSDIEKTDDAFVEGAMSMLAAQVPVRVLEVSAAQHQRVARGELLVRLDPADYAARNVEAFVNIFNVFDSQEQLNQDENYTYDSANPIVGGDDRDLKHMKTIDAGTGTELNQTAALNKNYGQTGANSNSITIVQQAPRALHLGFRITF